jgi:hypothetical protein
MNKIIPILLGLGAYVASYADLSVKVPSPTKSERKFRFIKGANASDSVALVDLVVAYDTLPSWITLKDKSGASLPISKYLVDSVFKPTSNELFEASKGAVQLGRIIVVPLENMVDADIVILADSTSTICPPGLGRIGDAAGVCADANTGGYLGLGWWLPTATKSDSITPLQHDRQPIFVRKDTKNLPISNAGAHIRVSWNTLKNYPSTVLIHEFGHYLFGMRDEYEGHVFTTLDQYTDAHYLANPSTYGVSLDNATYGGNPGWDFLTTFNGYAMSYLSGYLSLKKGYSDKFLPTSTITPEADIGDAINPAYAIAEQISSVATRGNGVQRNGGMWSLETAIRTSKCEGDTNCTYTPTTKTTARHIPDSVIVDYYGRGVGNIFLLDNSGSTTLSIKGTNPQGINRWDAGVDFFGRLTHPQTGKWSVSYPANSKFGFFTFSSTPVELVKYPQTSLDSLMQFTSVYSPTGTKQLAFESNTAHPIPWVKNLTDIVAALDSAKSRFDADPEKPFRRNVVLISDGEQTIQRTPGFNSLIGLQSGYRVFAVSLDNDLHASAYGDSMQRLSIKSQSWDGEPGHAYFTNGDNSDGKLDESSEAGPKLAVAANLISNAINNFTTNKIAASQLFQDADREYPLLVDANMTNAQFAVAWSGTDVPKVWIFDSNHRQYDEGSYPGIVFRTLGNMKTYDVDLTKFPVGDWKIRIKSPVYDHPITIYPSISTKTSKLKVKVSVNPDFIKADGRLPVTVIVEDGRPIEGLDVTAVLVSRKTGVTQNIPLKWNGMAYAGMISGVIQPGLSDLTVKVVYPETGKVSFALGENYLPAALRPQYPYFAPRILSQDIWVPGAKAEKTISGLEAWTLQGEVNRSAGTRITLFLKNGTAVPWKGLRARYFFSLSEAPGGIPTFSPTYLAGNSKVTTGSVANRPGLNYVQFDFAGQTLQPGQSSSNGQNGGEGGYIVKSDWSGPWEASNDYSFNGMKTTWGPNSFINIYDSLGRLLVGNPDLDPPGIRINAAPVVTLSSPDLVVSGVAANFVANEIDPDGDRMTNKWTVNGVVVGTNSPSLSYTFPSAGTYAVADSVSDGVGGNQTVVTQTLVVQSASGACTAGNSRSLGAASSNQTVALTVGTNCFVVKDSLVVREWGWSKIQFQANSDNGVALSGLSVQSLPTGTATSLTGYSQTVPFADPGRGKNLYLKVQASTARSVRLNWWLQ